MLQKGTKGPVYFSPRDPSTQTTQTQPCEATDTTVYISVYPSE